MNYENKISDNEKKYRHSNPLQRFLISRFLNTISELVIESEPALIIDVGCGEGYLSNSLLVKDNQLNILGVELSHTSILNGKKVFPTQIFINGNIYELPFASHSIDLVVCTEVLEHLNTPQFAIAEMTRIAARRCVFSVPNEPFFMLSNLLRGKNISRFGNDIEHIQHWSRWSFQKFLAGNGLIVEQVITKFPWTIVVARLKNTK
jgi:ubiquinone/menaquinone biosynthesis C-methylase UbiE